VVLPGELALLAAADLAGKPYDVYQRGPPRPPCDAGRVVEMARYGPIEGEGCLVTKRMRRLCMAAEPQLALLRRRPQIACRRAAARG
jgi:hypothetical protein